MEFHVEDKYNFTKERDKNDPDATPETPSSRPMPGPASEGYFISPANTAALEKTGGAKQFAVTSEIWTRQLSGTIEMGSNAVLDGEFDWNEIP